MRRALWAMLAIVAMGAIALASADDATPAAPAAAAPAAGAAVPTSLLQAASKTYSASRARASLHAGEHASTDRFHSTMHRAGVAGPPRRAPARRAAGAPRQRRQDHSRAHQQQVMLDIVEKVLSAADAREAVSPLAAGGADPAAEAASEFHLLNSLMEAQSTLRERGAHSNERAKIGGVDRHYLQAVTDNAVANALRLVAKEHPSKRMHALHEPLHLYGVRKLWGNVDDASASQMHHDSSRTSLYSPEALADPYLSRNTHLDSLAETSSFAQRISPQLVYQLSDKDKAMLAQREQIRNKEYVARHKAHQRRRNKPTPKPSHLRRKAPVHARPSHKRAAHPIPVAHAASPAAAAGYPGASFLEQSVEVEVDDAAAFDAVHEQYLAELDAAEVAEQQASWSAAAELYDSEVAQESLQQLLHRFAPASSAEEDEATSFVELDSSLRTGHGHAQKQMPLRELGILLGLNPNKQNAPAPAASAEAAPTAPVAQAQAPAPAPVAQPAAAASMRFAQHRAGARTREDGSEEVAPVEEGAAPEGGEEAGPAAEEGGGSTIADDSFEAMVNAGEEYQPSSLKHPPPPPLPPPPPPPAPPKFD